MPLEDSILFAEEETCSISCSSESKSLPEEKPWKILVIDDDHDVHAVTNMIMRKFVFANRPISLINGYSGVDARRLIQEHHDAAIVLLDVVMETDREGLEVVEFIRDELKNPFVRIILRTGQPGHAPESEVIENYEINDYLEKVSLSDQRLQSAIQINLQAFNLLQTIKNNQQNH
ncbi:MAG: response regulator [Magnetococcales bacterium]|nr:response regulator [Magnetococcales bacterium]